MLGISSKATYGSGSEDFLILKGKVILWGMMGIQNWLCMKLRTLKLLLLWFRKLLDLIFINRIEIRSKAY